MKILVSKSDKISCGEVYKEVFGEVSRNIEIIDEEELKNKEGYKRVLFSAYVRTDIDNLVLMLDKGKFAEISSAPSLVLSGGVYPTLAVDIGLLSGKSILDKAFKVDDYEALKKLIGNSTCFPVGVLETNNNYILVFNVVISNALLQDPSIHLQQGFHFQPIETLEVSDSLQKSISDTLVIVRK